MYMKRGKITNIWTQLSRYSTAQCYSSDNKGMSLIQEATLEEQIWNTLSCSRQASYKRRIDILDKILVIKIIIVYQTYGR